MSDEFTPAVSIDLHAIPGGPRDEHFEDAAVQLYAALADSPTPYSLDACRDRVRVDYEAQRERLSRGRRAAEWARAYVDGWQRGRTYPIAEVMAAIPAGVDTLAALDAINYLMKNREVEKLGSGAEAVLGLRGISAEVQRRLDLDAATERRERKAAALAHERAVIAERDATRTRLGLSPSGQLPG